MSNSQYVGFANLPNQVHRKFIKKGFEFTLMMVGESGLGKSTLISNQGYQRKFIKQWKGFCDWLFYGLHHKIYNAPFFFLF